MCLHVIVNSALETTNVMNMESDSSHCRCRRVSTSTITVVGAYVKFRDALVDEYRWMRMCVNASTTIRFQRLIFRVLSVWRRE